MTVFEKNLLMGGCLFRDYLDDFKYQDAILNALRSWVKMTSGQECVALLEEWAARIYQSTPRSSKIRLSLVDMAVWYLGHKFWDKSVFDLPGEYIQDSIISLS
jgi:hypothetical protein